MRYKAVVMYNGTNYGGWQIQPNNNSIEETIEKVISKLLNIDTKIYASGRTDAGVHALGQVFHFDSIKRLDTNRFKYSLNSLLSSDIKILSIRTVDDNFDARRNAKSKTYIYYLSPVDLDVFTRPYVYFIKGNFNYSLFKKALSLFKGEHDFSSFTSKEIDEGMFIRNIYSISTKVEDDIVKVSFTGNGFMRYMIRFIVGTSLAVAQGREDLSYIEKRIDNKERNISSYKIDSNALFLAKVRY